LRQYAEFRHPNPTAKDIFAELSRRCGCRVRDLKDGFPYISRIIGYEIMFDRARDFQFMLRKECKLQLYKPLNYNAQGSLLLANAMFEESRIVLHSDCVETDRQWGRWSIQNERPATGYPMCETLLMVLSELREQGEMREPEELKPYGQQKKKLHDSLYNQEYEKNFKLRTPKARSYVNEYTC
jgi:hypothetical protein